VALPRDARLQEGQHAHQHAAEQHRHQGRQRDRARATLEVSPPHQETEEAEHHAAGADVHGVGRADGPGAQARHQGAADGHHVEVEALARGRQEAQDGERDGVGDEVGEAAVQERRRGDARQPLQRAGGDAEAVKAAAEEQRVGDLDGPQRAGGLRHERDAGPGLSHQLVDLLLNHLPAGHRTSCRERYT